MGEASGFEDSLRTEFLAERKRGVTFTGQCHVDTVGTGFEVRAFSDVPYVRCHFDPLV